MVCPPAHPLARMNARPLARMHARPPARPHARPHTSMPARLHARMYARSCLRPQVAGRMQQALLTPRALSEVLPLHSATFQMHGHLLPPPLEYLIPVSEVLGFRYGDRQLTA